VTVDGAKGVMTERGTWSNWSGSLRFEPEATFAPESERELAQLVSSAAGRGKKVRVVGAGHSSSPLVRTDDALVSLHHFKGVEATNRDACEATILGGTTIEELGRELHDAGLALHNTGDVDVQTLAGAIGTGTHGTGRALRNLSSILVGARLVTGEGRVVEVSEDSGSDLLRAMRVSLGTFGIFTRLRVKLVPAYHLHRREWCLALDELLPRLDELIEQCRNFDFYWYPRSDLTKARVMNIDGAPMPRLPGKVTLDERGPSHLLLPRKRTLKFDEMEYHFHASSALACFFEVREKIRRRWRKDVAWRVLVRTVREDDSMLSPANGRPTITLSVHHHAGLPFEAYFEDVEASFLRHDGRPHWGKKHSLTARELRAHYPDWAPFHAHRRAFDPGGTFITSDLSKLLLENGAR
jgi:FAD/FMN-containing dehydrogenase